MHTESTPARHTATMPLQIDGHPGFRSRMPSPILCHEPERELVMMSEREHRRIGHDLHDGICQELGALHFALQAAKRLAGTSSRLIQQLEVISQGVHRAIQHTRLIARGIAPFELEDGDLAGALRELTENTGTLHEIDCCLETHGPVVDFEPEAATHLFRIAQEAIQNALRHGAATRIVITLDFMEHGALLTITDNGTGLPDCVLGNPPAGMGWKIMRYRAGLLGGAVDMAPSADGSGVCVRCRFSPQALIAS
jgi:signal transduction histidine kinase